MVQFMILLNFLSYKKFPFYGTIIQCNLCEVFMYFESWRVRSLLKSRKFLSRYNSPVGKAVSFAEGFFGSFT